MKVRQGFVSNSSSSSFICDICGHDESGWDLGLDDAMMVECRRGHLLCDSHVEADDEYDRYNLCSTECPCCQLNNVTDDIIIKYLLHQCGRKIDDVKEEIKNTFKTSDNFYKKIK
jgi:hypothetical protein